MQKKRSASNVNNGKNQPSSKQASSKKNQEKEVDQLTDEPPLSPTSSITSGASSANHRKRSSKGGHVDGEDGAPKRAKQQALGGVVDLDKDDNDGKSKDGPRQRDSGIVFVVVEPDSETASSSSSERVQQQDKMVKEARKVIMGAETLQTQAEEEDADAAQALTALAKNE